MRGDVVPMPYAGTAAPLVRPEAIAEDLGVSVSLVYKLARAGRIPAHRVGGNWRFDRDEVRKATREAGAR